MQLAAGYDAPERPPYLWDTASMPDRDTACSHCDPNENPPLCCGVCQFERRRCDTFYPGQGRSEAVAQHLMDSGYRLKVGACLLLAVHCWLCTAGCCPLLAVVCCWPSCAAAQPASAA